MPLGQEHVTNFVTITVRNSLLFLVGRILKGLALQVKLVNCLFKYQSTASNLPDVQLLFLPSITTGVSKNAKFTEIQSSIRIINVKPHKHVKYALR